MMKDKQDPFSGMSLEELWQMFPVFLTEHRPVWAQWYQEEGKQRICHRYAHSFIQTLSASDHCIAHINHYHEAEISDQITRH